MKKPLSERDISTKFIIPAVKRAGWDEMAQTREDSPVKPGKDKFLKARWYLL